MGQRRPGIFRMVNCGCFSRSIILSAMFPHSPKIHFSNDDAYNGFGEIEGILSAVAHGLVLEFQVKDAMIGVVRSGMKELHTPYEAISQIRLKKTWFGSSIRLQVDDMSVLSRFPAAKAGEIVLSIKKRQRPVALDFISQLQLRLSEIKLERLGVAK